jgi:hypothetical protein
MVSKGYISMRGIQFRCLTHYVLTKFRHEPEPCPHIPYDWIITTARPGSQKLTATSPSSKVSPTLRAADKDFALFHRIRNTWLEILTLSLATPLTDSRVFNQFLPKYYAITTLNEATITCIVL